MTVSVTLPVYLFQWTANKYNAVNSEFAPQKGSPVAQFLRAFLSHKSQREVPDPKKNIVAGSPNLQEMKIRIPHFPGKDPAYYNCLSTVAQCQLRDLLRDLFDIELFKDFARFDNIGIDKSEFIYSWMEAHAIENTEQNWLAVSKRLQLLIRRDNDRERKRK